MSLLVAGVNGTNIWMVSDTAVTGGAIDLRERVYAIKIVPSRDGHALLGFAGDVYHGTRLLDVAAELSSPTTAISALADGHRQYPSVSFAYGYIEGNEPHLIRVTDGSVKELQTLHLGVTDAFEHFQRIRHDAEIDPAPEAVKTFVCGARGREPVPDALSLATTSMLRLFAEREERDVGGWAVPYLLTEEGAFLCSYSYAVSDPILTKIGPGSVLPHGTAEAGGFGLSLTELGEREGLVVYWLQRAAGTVYLRRDQGHDVISLEGNPSLFRERALEALGRSVDLFFSELPHGMPESIAIIRDAAGIPSIAIARHGDSFSFSVLNVGTPFKASGQVNLNPNHPTGKLGADLTTNYVTIELSDDKARATLNLVQSNSPANEIGLSSSDLDAIIAVLGEARSLMTSAVPLEPSTEKGTRELLVLDPAWRTDHSVHSALSGAFLRLRHPGFGWLAFLIPPHEMASLGKWLSENAVCGSNTAPPGQGEIEKNDKSSG